jgi:DNA-binding sugar fermentation-stimulating protein
MATDPLRITLGELLEGVVVDRPNRFVAVVMLDGKEVRCHVADSGRLKELIYPGNKVMVRYVGNERAKAGRGPSPRKTSFDLVLAAAPPPLDSQTPESRERDPEVEEPKDREPQVREPQVLEPEGSEPERPGSREPEKDSTTWVSVDTRYPTRLFGQALRARGVPEFAGYDVVRAEYSLRKYERKGERMAVSPDRDAAGKGLLTGGARGAGPAEKTRGRKEPRSRFDFYLEGPGIPPALAEVKSVTLCADGKGLFPDAPTARGTRHVRELAEAVSAGFRAYAVFIAQREDILTVSPNRETDPKFAGALADAASAGVRLLAYRCKVSPEEIVFDPALLPVVV